MTRKGSSRSVDPAFAHGHLENARAYLTAAVDLLELTDPGSNTHPILSHVVTAAIGYADALTARTADPSTRRTTQASSGSYGMRSGIAYP